MEAWSISIPVLKLNWVEFIQVYLCRKDKLSSLSHILTKLN